MMNLQTRLSLAAILLGLCSGMPQNANAEPKLLVTDTAANVVLDFTARDGGDISGAVFASGLGAPGPLCVGPHNEIYVGEFGAGEVTVITDGGDKTGAAPFAFVDPMLGVLAPSGLWCSDEAVILASTGFGTSAVIDITAGGTDLSAWTVHVAWPGAVDVPAILALERHPDGTLLTSSTQGLLDATLAASPMSRPIVAPGVGGENVVPLAVSGMLLLGGAAGPGNTIYDLTDAEAVDEGAVFATVPTPPQGGILGLLDAGDLGVFAATYDGIYDITGGGDHTADAPIATGLSQSGLPLVGMVFHECTLDADCSDADACNGEEVCSGGRCQPSELAPDCDDGNFCTVDSCNAEAGCMNDPTPNCCVEDLDCAVDALCDSASNECVPANAPTGEGDDTEGDTEATDSDSGASSDAGGSTAGASVSETTGAGETGTDTDEAGADAPAGCSCTAPADGTMPWMLIGLLGLVRRRR